MTDDRTGNLDGLDMEMTGDDSLIAIACDSGQPPVSIGPYKILQLLGEGGFGCVYLAQQLMPIRRTVALKVIKLGMDTKQVIARFEAERQALAMMDHPNIAKVLDAGATETGRPYFVMELVKGVPITEYCDTNNLTTRERLVLFVLACHAVHHAHQKGIIHRDIKPSNVLITMHDGKPDPKVIDFGIAKAINQRLTEKTVFTEFHQLIGTPEYMSPEQAEMTSLDIDTRSDIYSLGVVLYELLTSTTPFDSKELREAGYGEIQRIIREVEPSKPSTRLSTMGEKLTDVARRRQIEPRSLTKLLRGDLDWIVMKCLEKDRTRRYETANDLAMDVLRYLCDEAVSASPPTWSYRLRKFVRRNRGLVIGASLVIFALLGGIAGSVLFAIEARQVRDAAMRQSADLSMIIAISRLNLESNEWSDLIDAAEESRQTYYQLGLQNDPECAATELVLGHCRLAMAGDKPDPAACAHLRSALTSLEVVRTQRGNLVLFVGTKPKPSISPLSWLSNSDMTVQTILVRTLHDLVKAEQNFQNHGEAARLQRRLLLEADSLSLEASSTIHLHLDLVILLIRSGAQTEADQAFERLMQFVEAGHRDQAFILTIYTQALMDSNRPDLAEKVFHFLYEWTSTIGQGLAQLTVRSAVQAYESSGDTQRAAEWRARLTSTTQPEE